MSVYTGFDFGVLLSPVPSAANDPGMIFPLNLQALLKPLQNGCLEVEFYYAGTGATGVTTTNKTQAWTLTVPASWGLPNTTVIYPGYTEVTARGLTGSVEAINMSGTGVANVLTLAWWTSASALPLGGWRYKMLFSGKNKIVA